MLSKEMQKTLNKQVELEAYASALYLSMASWCEDQAMEGSAQFMHRQSEEEREHQLKIFHYIIEMDGRAIVPAVKKPPMDFKTVQNMYEAVYEHEQKVTNSINKIVEQCYRENDFTTLNFLQWFVDEQREEEALMRNILDRIKLIGEGPQSLFYIDKEIEKINDAALKAAAAEEGA